MAWTWTSRPAGRPGISFIRAMRSRPCSRSSRSCARWSNSYAIHKPEPTGLFSRRHTDELARMSRHLYSVVPGLVAASLQPSRRLPTWRATARDPAALERLLQTRAESRGRPKPFGEPGEVIIRRLAQFWETFDEVAGGRPKQADGSLRPNQGAQFVQDAAAAVMGVKGNARPSPGRVRDILRARTVIDP